MVSIVLRYLELMTGTKSFVSAKQMLAGSWFAAVPATKKQFFDQVEIRLISQLITGISSFLQKLLRYFNGTMILTTIVPSCPVCFVIFSLNLNEMLSFLSAGKSIITFLFKAGSSIVLP